ncbi:PEP-CTERM sorting domain-containing protein [Methylobacillus sp. Pita1]|uniref:PEP-CTERM sorting domain-containing protein n=1 Tax=Methylobacillus sp. Pita1 TaxID=3382642 RepID=UPI0038B47CFB
MRHLIATMFVSASLFSGAVFAEDLHAGDIIVTLNNGQFEVGSADSGLHYQEGTGYAIFEGDFRDFARGPYATSNPGFDSPTNSFAPDTIIGYQAIGNLWSWTGDVWTNVVNNGESISVAGAYGETTTWDVNGINGDTFGLIGQAGSTGKIHSHLDFSISSASGSPTDGIYFITLQLVELELQGNQLVLSDNGYLSSNPFYLVLNNGLSASDAHHALHDLQDNLVVAVPEPSTYAMFLAGLGLMGWQLRRRQQA